MPRPPVLSPGVSTSLNSAQITPRTPHAVRPKYEDVEDLEASVDAEEVEMGLLSAHERESGFADGNGHLEAKHRAPFSMEDKRAMVLLCVLCTWLPPSLPSGAYNQTTARFS
jgi:hypothetical protein